MKHNFRSIIFTIMDLSVIYFIIGVFTIVLYAIATTFFPESIEDIVASLMQCLIFIIIPIFVWKFIKRRDLSEMGLKNFKDCSTHFKQGLIIGIISITLCVILAIIFGGVNISFTNSFRLQNYFAYLLIFIFVSFSEEIFTRGYMQSTISNGSKKGKFIALIITSIIFTYLHLGNNNISTIGLINICLMGLLYGYMYYTTDNIWMPIGCHFTWNFLQGTVFGFNVSGAKVSSILESSIPNENLLNGGGFGIEGSIFCTIIFILQIIFIYKTYTKNSSLKQS